MRLSCDVIKDLTPLYAEGMLSETSVDLVEEHLEECEDCQLYLQTMNQKQDVPEDHSVLPLLKMKNLLRKKKAVAIGVAIALTLLFSALFFSFLSAPDYIPYSEGLLEVTELSDGSIIVQMNQEVHGYDINETSSEDGDGSVYHVTTWTTTLGEAGLSDGVDRIVLTNEEESVASVYYYQTDGTLDTLIHGRNENINGGTMILPRLNLTYYFAAAGIVMVTSLIAVLVFRKHNIIARGLLVILLVSTSYIVSHMIVRGMTSASYQSTRDLLAILSITLPLSALIYFATVSYTIRKERQTAEKVNDK
ncbi:MAG: zf-HC2 domain-containing protein [Alkalibacterium sp.]|nr:zf-HC2 domain-containing protein [Alkalibacterium sp.]